MEVNFRHAIITLSHQWHIAFIAFLVGGIAGWFGSALFPADFRAEAGLYVAYNADAIFRNPDDYKNWQLGELDAYVHSDEVLQATLERLKMEDSSWGGLTHQDLQPALKTYWRNAGNWRLAAEWPNAPQARQLAIAWRNTALEMTTRATGLASSLTSLESEKHTLANKAVELDHRIVILTHAQEQLKSWLDSASEQDPQEIIPTLETWQLQSIVSVSTDFDPAGLALWANLPSAGTERATYQTWVTQALELNQKMLDSVQAQATSISSQQETLNQKILAITNESHGLSSSLVVEQRDNPPAEAIQLRPQSQLAIVGAFLALLLWIIIIWERATRMAAA